MLIPPTIDIAGITYDIVFRKDPGFHGKETPRGALYDALGRDDEEEIMKLELEVEDEDNGLVAHIDFMRNRIVLGEALSDQGIDISFWHEIVHGIDFAMGYVPMDEPDYMPIDERTVESRAQLLLQVIRQVVDYNIAEATK